MNATNRTNEQNRIAEGLATQFAIDKDRVFFPDPDRPNDPWLGANELIAIARQSDRFQAIEAKFTTVIVELNQIVHSARVVDKEGRIFERIGVATLGENTPGSAKPDEHGLADSRAIVATLSAAGFNPLRSGSLGLESSPDAKAKSDMHISIIDDAAESRRNDIRRIHALAEEVGYIVHSETATDDRLYRRFLFDNYKTTSVAGFDATQRASVINKLQIIKGEMEAL